MRRVVRHAILDHRFFQEKILGVITHSAPTAVLVGDELARNALVVRLDGFWPAAVKVKIRWSTRMNVFDLMFPDCRCVGEMAQLLEEQ